ncbi:MAG: hypothetical protein ACFBSC_18820 [Microcoleaceae cyanobacterium]
MDWTPTWNHLAEFSRINCLTICAGLVPANLIATLQTLIFTGLKFSTSKYSALNLPLMTSFASAYAGLMVLHVYTWFCIGVVQAPTFILLFLGGVCLGLNSWAIAAPANLSQLLQQGFFKVRSLLILTVSNKRWVSLNRD